MIKYVTLFIGIQWGIIIGAIFTLFLLVNKSSHPSIVQMGYVKNEKTFRNVERYPEAITSDEVLILRVDSSLHFANISYIEEKIRYYLKKYKKVKWLIIDMSGVNDVDTISVDTLEDLIEFCDNKKITVLFASMKGSIRDTVDKAKWNEKYTEQSNHLTLEQLLKSKGISIEKEEAANPHVLDYQI